MKKLIIGFILGGIIFGSIGIYAASYLATDVSYTPTNETWEVDNVNDALNSLYELNSKDEGTKIINLGTGTTFDVSNYEGYENFTIDNFIIEVTNISGTSTASFGSASNLGSRNVWGQGSISGSISKKYAANTGIFTISNGLVISGNFLYGDSLNNLSSSSRYANATPNVVYNVYLIY